MAGAAGAAVAAGTAAMRVHIVSRCGLAPCTACMVSCLPTAVTSLLPRVNWR